jgi:hypothetical protein
MMKSSADGAVVLSQCRSGLAGTALGRLGRLGQVKGSKPREASGRPRLQKRLSGHGSGGEGILGADGFKHPPHCLLDLRSAALNVLQEA